MQLSTFPPTTEKTLPIRPTKAELAHFFGYSKTESLYTDIITPQLVAICIERNPVLGKFNIFTFDFIASSRCQRIPKPLRDLICEVNGLPLYF